jgi:hypothetical protein
LSSSVIIDTLEREDKPDNDNEPQAKIPHLYYYFNFRNEATQTCENFLLSIMCQLLSSIPGSDVPMPFKHLYLKKNEGKNGRPSIKEMIGCIITTLQNLNELGSGVREVRLIVDAVDECSEWELFYLFFNQLAKSKCQNLHFIFTSRPEKAIQAAVEKFGIPSVDLVCTEMDKDIEKYVRAILDNEPQFMHIDPNCREEVKEILVKKAGGM